MKSQSTIASAEKNSVTVQRLLDATRDAVVQHGVRLTTVQDIADRAGVSRMTFYRQFSSVPEAVLRALTREFQSAVGLVSGLSGGGTARHRLVKFAIEGVRVYAADPMITSIVTRDSELLVPYLTERFGASQELILAAIESLFVAGAQDGSIKPSGLGATMILLMMQSVAVPAKILIDRGQFEAALSELELLLHAYLDVGDSDRTRSEGEQQHDAG